MDSIPVQMSEYMYSVSPSLPYYPRPSRRRNSSKSKQTSSSPATAAAADDDNHDADASASAEASHPPRSRRSFLRPVSRSSSGSGSGKVTRATDAASSGSTAGSTTPTSNKPHGRDTEAALAARARANSSGGAAALDGDSSDTRASSTGGSAATRATAASLAASISGSGSSAFTTNTTTSSTTTPRASTTSRPAKQTRFRPSNTEAFSVGDLKNVAMYPDSDASKHQSGTSKQINPGSSSFSRTESVSSTSVTTALSTRTVTSTDPSASEEATNNFLSKPFAQRSGRTYLNDPTLPYPLPVDLPELHRQSLRTLLLIQVHGAPVACPALTAKPPQKVLEIGCGPGFWSMMCHRYFKSRGHSGIQFVGIDVAPLSPGSANMPSDSIKPDKDMNWTFIQHDLRSSPWPFEDGEFDMVLNKDMTLAVSLSAHMGFTEECLRVLKSGGVLEIWETDHTIRMLRPHVPNPSATGTQAEEQESASSLGAYIININTPLSAPLNPFLVEYNNWLNKALEARELMPNPCTVVNAYLLQESEALTGVGSHRVAIPLSEVRWEREGVGGVVTKDGKSYVEMKGKGEKLRPPHQKVEKKTLTAGQAALRRTALLTLVDEIQAMEPMLREVSGKSQDEWDMWMGKMSTDLMSESGTSWGECLESGAWWARKK